MPAPYTHNKFGKDVYNKLNKNIQIKLKNNIDYYLVFNQSFDNLFFYKFYTILHGSNIRKLGSYGHKNNVNLYFKNIIDYLKENYSDVGFAYLCGSINHYILDSTVHPFVFYKTGVYNPKDKDSFKYNGMHGVLEFNLDAYIYKETNNRNISKIKTTKELHKKLKFPKELIDIIDYTFEKTFNFYNMGKIFNKAYLDSKFAYKYGFEDRYGIKKIIYKSFDFVTKNMIKNISSHSTYINKIDTSMFNLDNKNWCHPTNKNITYTSSIIDLYNSAMNHSKNIIENIYLYINNKYDYEKLLKEIGNNSYTTGLPLDKNKKMKVFEY